MATLEPPFWRFHLPGGSSKPCGSHLSVVSLYYGAIIGLYFFPSSSSSSDKNIIASVMYMVVTLLLNPFIYSLRNRDMKLALGILFRNNILFTKWESPNCVISPTDLVRDAFLKNCVLNTHVSCPLNGQLCYRNRPISIWSHLAFNYNPQFLSIEVNEI